MEPEDQPPLRRNPGSFGVPPPQRRGTDTLRQFGDSARHVPPRAARDSSGPFREPESMVPFPSPYMGAPDYGRYPYQQYQSSPYQQYGVYPPPQPPIAGGGGRWYQAGPGPALYAPPPMGAPAASFSYEDAPSRPKERPLYAGKAYSVSRSRSPVRTRARRNYRTRRRVDPEEDYDEEEDEDSRDDDETEDDRYGRISPDPRYLRPANISRRHGGRVYDGIYRDEGSDYEADYDADVGGKVFSFTPLRAEASESNDGDLGRSTEDAGERATEDGPSREKPKELVATATSKVVQISASQYTGDAFFDGNHSAKLTVVHDPKRSRQPLFRWLHLQQAQLNLDELSAEITRIPGLSDTERHGFTRLLSQVRDTVKVRRNADGGSARHMNTGSIRINIQDDNRSKGPGFGSKGNKRPLTWLCIPYFLLAKYSGLMAASSAASFPMETLLQSDYAPTSRERDMEQAVVRNGAAPDGECFHIDQVWVLVLDDSLLITCGRMPSATLRGDVVKIATEPLIEPASKARTLFVSYYESVLWALPLDSCLSWFAFATHFHEFWPQAIRFYHRDKLINKEEWPRIVNLVKYSNTNVTIDLRMGPHPPPPTAGVLQPLRIGKKAGKASQGTRGGVSQHKSEPAKTTLPQRVNDTFHVFTWMENVQLESTESSELDMEAVAKQLQVAEEFLLGSTTMRERRAYQICPSSSRQVVHAYLEERGKEIDSSANDRPKKKQDYEDRVDIYNAAELVFRFFLPWRIDKDAPTVGKFWGALQCLIGMPAKPSDAKDEVDSRQARMTVRQGATERNVVPLRLILRSMIGLIQSFQAILSHAPASDRLKIDIPDNLVRAWLHLTMGLAQSTHDPENWHENIDVANSLIRKGMSQVMEDLPMEDLLKSIVIQPMEFASLLAWKLMQDSTGNSPNLNDTYSEYIKQLEHEITTNPDRSNQYRIDQLRKEIAVIRGVMKSQHKVLEGMARQRYNTTTRNDLEARLLDREIQKKEVEKSQAERARFAQHQQDVNRHYAPANDGQYKEVDFISNRDPFEFSKLSSTDPGGVAELIVRDCRSWIERREYEFLEFDIEATRLEVANSTNLDITKDRQEKAVYAFTMVTIVFLPLSTISSIFGMNTADVANMELTQWVYWATALPTTLLVIVGGLWWMGELENLVRWLLWMPRGSQSRRGGRRRIAVAATQPQPEYPSLGYGPGPVPPPYVEVIR